MDPRTKFVLLVFGIGLAFTAVLPLVILLLVLTIIIANHSHVLGDCTRGLGMVLLNSTLFVVLFIRGISTLEDTLLFILDFSIRLSYLLILTQLFTLTTSTRDLLVLFSSIRIPRKIAIMFIVAFTAVPILIQELKKIENAQKARGFNWLRKLSISPIIIPAVLSIINRAWDTTLTIHARGLLTRKFARKATRLDIGIAVITVALGLIYAVYYWQINIYLVHITIRLLKMASALISTMLLG